MAMATARTAKKPDRRLAEARWMLGRSMVIYGILQTADAELRADRIGEALDLGAIDYFEATELAR